MKIGILGFQGAVIEHQRHIEQLGQEAVVVRYTEQLAEIDGIILPGGESTTMGKLLNRTGMMEPLREKIQQGMPVWGTCAGMILLAKELDQDPVVHLGMMDITVRRNAYGTQIDSFDTQVVIPEDIGQFRPDKLFTSGFSNLLRSSFCHKKADSPLVANDLPGLQIVVGTHHSIRIYFQLYPQFTNRRNPFLSFPFTCDNVITNQIHNLQINRLRLLKVHNQ